MHATVTLPFFIRSSEDHDDFDVQIDLLTKILKFDEEKVAELKKDNKKSPVLDVLYMGNGYSLVYSPLFVGPKRASDDFAVHAFFDEIQCDYDLNPKDYFTSQQMRAFKKSNSLPEHLSWEIMQNLISPLMETDNIQQQFETWLAGKQKQMLLNEVGDEGVAPTVRKI